MTRITKLRLHGFKSFAKKTDLIFGDKFNLILGANGSGKSNIFEAICFVLGKSSAKSLRAEKSANLIYNGGKHGKPASFAEVSIFFDNNNKEFPVDSKEVKITRIVKQNGQSDYRINDKKTTRQQVIDLLAAANIDPDGHNFVLQGDIVHFIEIKPIERRQLIEEIAGISVFEDKKIKAMSELERVEERLKEANIMLAEREAHLRELKKERDQAKRYKDLQDRIKDNKATYNYLRKKEKEKKIEAYDKAVSESNKKLEKINSKIKELNEIISKYKSEINEINNELDTRGEKEQRLIRQHIIENRSDIVKARTRMETIHSELKKIDDRVKQLKESIKENHKKLDKYFAERKKIINEISKLEQSERRLTEKIESSDKSDLFEKKINELARLRSMSSGGFSNTAIEKISDIQGVHGTIANLGRVSEKYALALEVCAGVRMKSVIVEDDIVAQRCIEKLKQEKLGVVTFLPLNKIKPKTLEPTLKPLIKKEGVHGIALDLIKFDKKYEKAFSNVFGSTLIVDNIDTARSIGIGKVRMVTLDGDLIETSGVMVGGYRRGPLIGFRQTGDIEDKILKLEREIESLRSSKSPLEDEKQEIRAKILELNSEIKTLDSKIDMIADENDRMEKIIKDHEREKREFLEELEDLKIAIKNKESGLRESEGKERMFYASIKTLAARRNKLEQEIEKKEKIILEETERARKIENKLNELKIYRAQVVAELEGLKAEFEEYKDGTIRRNVDINTLKKEIAEWEKMVQRLGNVNMRALEVYDELAEKYKELLEKVNKLKAEKEDVLDMIAEIEAKKTGVFMETFNNINARFKRIFSELSNKGVASLVLENKEKPLEGGLDINVEISRGKYLDIRSLSGGEKTLAALAFIFAIQEYNPASFYVLDEVDAALDKHNSEKLGKLFSKYAEKAQYIVISHNDSVISEADVLYGVSMQEGVSKVTGLRF
jgi:chromosome segregation protein